MKDCAKGTIPYGCQKKVTLKKGNYFLFNK